MYKAGDIFLCSGEGFFSRGIRKFTQGHGETPTIATHVGVIVRGGSPDDSVVIEALSQGVVEQPFMQGPGKGQHAVYRPINFSDGAIAAGVAVAHRRVKMGYGWGKIATQVFDFAIPYRDKKGNPPYVFRRIAGNSSMPICSYLADEVVSEQLLYDLRLKMGGWASPEMVELHVTPFGCPRNRVTPDDIMDFCEGHPDKYERVRVMGPA